MEAGLPRLTTHLCLLRCTTCFEDKLHCVLVVAIPRSDARNSDPVSQVSNQEQRHHCVINTNEVKSSRSPLVLNLCMICRLPHRKGMNIDHTVWKHSETENHRNLHQMPLPPVWTCLAMRDCVASFKKESGHANLFNFSHSYDQEENIEEVVSLLNYLDIDIHTFRNLEGLPATSITTPCKSVYYNLLNWTVTPFSQSSLLQAMDRQHFYPLSTENTTEHNGIDGLNGFLESPIDSNVNLESVFSSDVHTSTTAPVPDIALNTEGESFEFGSCSKDCEAALVDEEIMETPSLFEMEHDCYHCTDEFEVAFEQSRPANPVAQVLECGDNEHMVPITIDMSTINDDART